MIQSEQTTADTIRQAESEKDFDDYLTAAMNHAAALMVWAARTWKHSVNRQQWAAALYVKIYAEDILQALNDLKAGEQP